MLSALGAWLLVLLGQTDCTQALATLRAGLAEYRRDPGGTLALDAPALARLATQLCSDCQRCDAKEVVRYYTSLTPEDLRLGLSDEERFVELRDDIIAAGREGLAGSEWIFERERILLGLDELSARCQVRADYVPAAQAASLVARLRMQQLESGWTQSQAEQSALAEEVARSLALAQQLFQRAGMLTPRLEPWWVEARLLAWRGDFLKAEQAFRECLAQAEHLGNEDFREHALRGLAQLAREQGDLRAQERALANIAQFRSPQQSWALACDWAAQLLARDRASQAIEFLERCPPPADGNASDRAEWNLLMGGAWLRMGDWGQAGDHLRALEQLGGGEAAALALAQLALAEGRDAQVPALLTQPVAWTEFSSRGQAQARTLLGKLALRRGELAAAVRELGAALALGNVQEERMALQVSARLGPDAGSIAHGRAASVMGEWLGLEAVALYATALARSGAGEDALRIVLEAHARDLRGEADSLQALRALAGMEGPAWRISIEDTRAWVQTANLGLVTWVVGADTTLALYATIEPDGNLRVLHASVARGRESLAEAARRLREAVAVARAHWFAREARAAWSELFPTELQAALLERIEQAASPAKEARLLIVAHGPLEGFPLELMPVNVAGAPLESQCVPLVLPGISRSRPQEPPDSGLWLRWVLLGAPRDPSGKQRLEGAESELRQVAKERPQAELFLGAKFQRAALEGALQSGRCLHIATHLLPGCRAQAEDIDGASLELDGGQVLCVREVAALDPASPLVVLSTCESGGGSFVDGQGLQGLARALLQGGTRNVVATLWPVSDRAAAHFSVAFHTELALGALPSVATHRARAALERLGIALVDRAAFRCLGQD